MNWKKITQENTSKLEKTFVFRDFKEAQQFVNSVADLAENHNHHPNIKWNYTDVKLTLSTHSEGNVVTQRDEKLAEEIDAL